MKKVQGLLTVVGAATLLGSACGVPPDGSVAPPPDDTSVTKELVLAAGNSVVGGAFHTCAIVVGGGVTCWGDNQFGQLGRGDFGGAGQLDPLKDYTTGRETFVNLGTGRTATALAAGFYHTCAMLDNSQVKCWGNNSHGELGLGDTLTRGADPQNVSGFIPGGGMGDSLPQVNLGNGRTAKAITAGGTHTCAILDTNQVKCWGEGYGGKLGYGDINNRGDSPGQMGDFLPVVDFGTGRTAKVIEATTYNTCVIMDNNHVRCWGLNISCTLGEPATTNYRGNQAGTMGDNMPDLNLGVGRTATAIVAGDFFFCALRDNATVKCWGDNTVGQIGINSANGTWGCSPSEMGDAGIISLGGNDAVSIAAGGSHACAVRSNGEVRCWGSNTSGNGALAGELGVNTSPIPTKLLAPSGPLVVGASVRAVAAGGYHTCAITTGNKARCWGLNDVGQLGTNITDTAVGDVPGDMSLLVDTSLGTRQVFRFAAGGAHTCAILGAGTTGAAKCWGYNGEGELGVGDTFSRGDEPGEMGNSLAALALGTGRTAKWFAAGQNFSCAALDNNTLKCWGDNVFGQLGLGNFTPLTSPSATAVNLGTGRTVHATVASPVAAGSGHTCVILDNSLVKCWGNNNSGQLGYGDMTTRTAPASTTINLGTGRTAKAIAAGDGHSCAILDDNTVKCWGSNANGQLGDGTTTDRLSPPATAINLGTGRTAKAVAVGSAHSCALLDNNLIKCWGWNGSAQLGQGDTTQRNSPPSSTVNLGTGQTALAIASGFDFVCALLATNQAKCWGNNVNGQLGTWEDMTVNGDFLIGDSPNEMGDFLAVVNQGAGRTVKAIAPGSSHTCFLLDSNQVRCTGDNSAGQLGQGNTDTYEPFGQPAGLVDLGTDP